MSTKNAATQKSNHRRKKSITDVLFRTKITACNNIFYSNGKKYKKNLHNKNKRYKFANEILLPTKGTLSPLFCIENKMISEQRIIKIFEDNPEIFGEYFLVEVKVSGDNDISIRIDKDNGLSIDECGQISHQIDTLLNREEEDFNLEVSSPGLTEPFKVTKQYIKNIGHQVEVLTTAGDKIKGVLIAADADGATIEETIIERIGGKKQKTIVKTTLPYGDIKQTKLILSFK